VAIDTNRAKRGSRPAASKLGAQPPLAVGDPASRIERTRAAILDATREILAEGGVRVLTVEAVSARSGVAKTSIYRRWRGKHELALAVLLDMVATVVATPDLGDARAELTAFVNAAVRILGSTLMGPVMKGLVSDLATDPKLARAFQSRVVALRLAEVERLLKLGVERGEVRPDADVVLTHELLFGPVYYRLLLSGGKLDSGLASRIVDAVWPSIAAGEPRAAKRRRP
jgi:AcrR family transcriptional regulator